MFEPNKHQIHFFKMFMDRDIKEDEPVFESDLFKSTVIDIEAKEVNEVPLLKESNGSDI